MAPHDRTRTALQRQLKGMGLDLFELTILRGDEHRSVHLWSPEEILTRLPNLKRANMAGSHIYARGPRDQDHDLILLDDLDRFTPDRMKIAGHDPAVVVETSPGSIQAWIKLGRPCSASIRHEVAREMTRLYGGDTGAVDPHQSGRLAGFTNRKPKHESGRGFPFVLLLNAPGKPAPNAPALIEQAETAVKDRERVEEQTRAIAVEISASGDASNDLVAAWSEEYRTRGGDLSAVDFAVCCRALKAGLEPDDVAAALSVVADRKGRYAERYAERTVRAAVRSLSQPSPSSPS